MVPSPSKGPSRSAIAGTPQFSRDANAAEGASRKRKEAWVAPRRRQKVLPARRSVAVVLSLLLALVGLATVLSALRPAPIAPAAELAEPTIGRRRINMERVFQTHPSPRPARWKGIVVHHSGRSFGNAQTLADRHRDRGAAGLGYHFVIGNGNGAPDGGLFIGYRWRRQLPAAAVEEERKGRYHRRAIAIGLIGNGNETRPTRAQLIKLRRLVRALRARLDIPRDHVRPHRALSSVACPGREFPLEALRGKLPRQARR